MENWPAIRRVIETVLALVVIVYGVRITLPLTPGVADHGWLLAIRIVLGLVVLSPGVVLLFWPNTLGQRMKALLGVAGSNLFVTCTVLGNDWTRFATAGAALGLSVIAFILYAGARAEGRKRD